MPISHFIKKGTEILRHWRTSLSHQVHEQHKQDLNRMTWRVSSSPFQEELMSFSPSSSRLTLLKALPAHLAIPPWTTRSSRRSRIPGHWRTDSPGESRFTAIPAYSSGLKLRTYHCLSDLVYPLCSIPAHCILVFWEKYNCICYCTSSACECYINFLSYSEVIDT